MLKGFSKHRPKQLIAVYAEPQQVEVLRAHREWRSWQIDSTERFNLTEGENLFDYLQRLNLRPRSKKGTALLLFLPRTYYSFHREHYPSSLKDELEEALTFDWQENAFYDIERTFHFFGPAVSVNRHLSVPIFSIQREVYDRFDQVLGGSGFQSFSVIPSALTFSAFFPASQPDENSSPIVIMGRKIDPSNLEIHRFYNGRFLDSFVIGKNFDSLKLFRENLICLGDAECQDKVHIHLLCTVNEATEEYTREWREEGLPIKVHNLKDSFVSHWVKYLFEQDQIQTFDAPLILKPWKAPKFIWPLLVILGLYSAFTFYQLHAVKQLQDAAKVLKKQNTQLEAQWKPIEQLQTRIAKFQEDQKTLSEFNSEGHPLFEILTVLSQVTPDDTWLNYLSVRKGQLVLRGESKSAIKYLSELSKVEGFSDVRFASPVTRNPTSDSERFNLQLQLDPEKLKKTLESLQIEKDIEKIETEAPVVAPAPAPVDVKPKQAPTFKAPEDGEEDEVFEEEEEIPDEEVAPDEVEEVQ